MILAALKHDQLSAALSIAGNNSTTVFASPDEKVLAKVKDFVEHNKGTEIPVYFYEAG